MHKLKDLNPNPKNPRTITNEQLSSLKKSIDKFGDLGCFVWNRRSGNIVCGHQRQKVAPEQSQIIITERYDQPTEQGTTAIGHILIGSEKFAYREIDVDDATEKAMNLASNKHGGEFDMVQVGEWLTELNEMKFDIELTGFDLSDIPKIASPDIDPVQTQSNKLNPLFCECPECGHAFDAREHKIED